MLHDHIFVLVIPQLLSGPSPLGQRCRRIIVFLGHSFNISCMIMIIDHPHDPYDHDHDHPHHTAPKVMLELVNECPTFILSVVLSVV